MEGMAQGESVSTTVVQTIAEREGVEPVDLTPRLYEVVDPDALEKLFRPLDRAESSGVRVELAYGDRTVVVGPGDVEVR